MPTNKVLPQKISELTYAQYSVLKEMDVPRGIKEFDGERKRAFAELKKMGLITLFGNGYTWPAYVHTERGEAVLETIESNSTIMKRFEEMKKAKNLKRQRRLENAPLAAFGSTSKRLG